MLSTDIQYDTYVLAFNFMYNNLHIREYTGTCMHTARNADPAQVSTAVCTQNRPSQRLLSFYHAMNDSPTRNAVPVTQQAQPIESLPTSGRCVHYTCNNVHSCNHQGILQ